jgi:hypothetical protein
MHQGVLFNGALVRFDNNNKKNIRYNLRPPIFFSYMEHPLKHPQPIKGVVVEVFLKKFPNFESLF